MLQIVPTTTYGDLAANNTSASSSFPGWVPGLPKTANTSRIKPNIPQKIFVHDCDWWGLTNHPNIGVNSTDPVYCALTCEIKKAMGISGIYTDWYDKGSREDNSLLVMKPELEKRNMGFALCVDHGMASIKKATDDNTRTIALMNALNYARTTYFNSPSYLKVDGKPVLLFFGFSTADFNWSVIRKAFSDCWLFFRWEYTPTQYGDRYYADGYFGWTGTSEAWIANIRTRAPGKQIILGINGGFNNTDPVLCPWGIGKNKVIDTQGGLTMQNALALCVNHPEIARFPSSLNTWNDYQEKSAIEMGISSGQTLHLNETGGVLTWTPLTSVFDHFDVYISSDGKNFMQLNDIPIPSSVTSFNLVPLDLNESKYYFAVKAIAKSFVQNLVSNISQATMGWTDGV